MSTPLGRAVEFLRDFGLFDVIVPFILVFTIVFAILEKTMIFGKQKIGETEYPQKNLNGAIAFVIAMIVVATANVVSIINAALPNIILVSVISVSFLILIGVFWQTGELDFRTAHKRLYGFFVFLLLLIVLGIFFAAMPYKDSRLLMRVVNYGLNNANGAIVGSLIMLIAVVGIVWFLMNGMKPAPKPEEKKK